MSELRRASKGVGDIQASVQHSWPFRSQQKFGPLIVSLRYWPISGSLTFSFYIFIIWGKFLNLAEPIVQVGCFIPPKYSFLLKFQLMDHCGIKVKSELLSIFEHYLLPLGTDLRPALPGFITAVLMALEEGTEFYARAFQLLDHLLDKVGPDAFYTCFWQVGISSADQNYFH